jgi:hypothetical protein
MQVGLYSGNGTVALDGGRVEVLNLAGGLSMTARGSINIKGGSMLLEGDQAIVCKNYISSGWVIAYDGNGRVLIDYDNINPGKTTLWAVDSALAADFDNSNEVGLGDLSYLAMSWLETELQVRPVGDISGDSTVDGLDFSMFAGQWLSVKDLGFSRFIGPEDCPGASQFADPYVFKENDAFYLTSTYTVGMPMYMFGTTDFSGKERYSLNLDLNESYLRAYFSDPGLIAYHVWGLVPYKHPRPSSVISAPTEVQSGRLRIGVWIRSWWEVLQILLMNLKYIRTQAAYTCCMWIIWVMATTISWLRKCSTRTILIHRLQPERFSARRVCALKTARRPGASRSSRAKISPMW